MGLLLLGFLPWILYWALVGNVDFRFAVCIALGVVIGTQLISRIGESWPSLEASSLLIFGAAGCLEERAPLGRSYHVFRPVTEGARHAQTRVQRPARAIICRLRIGC